MAFIPIERTSCLDSAINIDRLSGAMFTQENEAHQFVITCTQNNAQLTLTGTITAKVVLANGNTVELVGTIDGGKAVVTLTQPCYNTAGRIQISIFNTVGSTKLCIYAAIAYVQTAEHGDLIDGSQIIDSVEDLIADIQAAVATIPPDYSTLSNQVADLKNATVNKELMQKCELINQPASPNRWNKDAMQVGMVHTNGRTYTGGSYDSYRYYDIGYVEAGSVITAYSANAGVILNNMSRVVAFDSDENAMSAESIVDGNNYIVPSGAAHIVISAANSVANTFMVLIDPEAAPTTFIPFSETTSYYVATKDFIPDGIVANKVDIDGVGQVTARNAQFIHFSPNLVDQSALLSGYYVNQYTGGLNEASVHYATDWLPVEPEADYTMSMNTPKDIRICWYDSNKIYLTGQLITNNQLELHFASPAAAQYCRFSGYIAFCDIQFEKGDTATPYMPYGTGYLKPEYASPENGTITINLPQKVYSLVGYELNIYFENLVEDWTAYTWDVACSKGMQLARGYRITPTEQDVGTYTLTITASKGSIAASAVATLVVTSASAGSGTDLKVMILGDSTTNNGIAVTKLNQNFSDDVLSISTIGTRGTAPNNHEGRSGWRFSSYFAPPDAGSVASGVENPWYNPTTETFDASYYFANTGVAVPDWFFINLGINDTFGYTTDTALDSAITTIKGLCDSMMESVFAAAPNVKIGLCLTIPPNHSQDAFGKAYSCSQTRDRYKRNNTIWVHDLIETYDGRESEGIYLIPIYTNLDTVYNMGFETMPVNARNTSMTYESPIGNGGVHPVESGYWQIADVYTAFLKAYAE